MKATEKQVSYALHLLRRNGYGTNFMRAEHKALGASMRERQGSVSNWLAGMTRDRISDLITGLREQAA